MKLTVTRVLPNGAVTATAEYDDDLWCIMVFPSVEAAETFAKHYGLEYALSSPLQPLGGPNA
jgi:hypothetical protein